MLLVFITHIIKPQMCRGTRHNSVPPSKCSSIRQAKSPPMSGRVRASRAAAYQTFSKFSRKPNHFRGSELRYINQISKSNLSKLKTKAYKRSHSVINGDGRNNFKTLSHVLFRSYKGRFISLHHFWICSIFPLQYRALYHDYIWIKSWQ